MERGGAGRGRVKLVKLLRCRVMKAAWWSVLNMGSNLAKAPGCQSLRQLSPFEVPQVPFLAGEICLSFTSIMCRTSSTREDFPFEENSAFQFGLSLEKGKSS